MRLAIIGDELDQDLARVLEAIRAAGFEGIEVRSVWNKAPQTLTSDELDAIRTAVAGARLAVCGFAPPVFKRPLPVTDAEKHEARAELLAAVAQAHRLGSPRLRIFSFYRGPSDPAPDRAAAIVRDLIAGALPDDLEIVVENGTLSNTPTMRHMLQFLDGVGASQLGILWDPGNSVFSGWGKTPFPDDYELARPAIRHVHVKDPDRQRAYVRLGEGDLPWAAIVRRLAEDGYSGWLSLETHWRDGRELTPLQRNEPWGDAFSSGGFEPSVACMARLADYVRATR